MNGLPFVDGQYRLLRLRMPELTVQQAADYADSCARALGEPTFCELEQPWVDALADILALPEVAA